MKSAILLALAFVLINEAQSQKTTIRFEGFNDRTKNYTVDIEGRKFTSAAALQKGSSNVRVFEINYLASGNHDLIVYAPQKEAIYNNRFQLKEDREMIISVNTNGGVSMTEKPTSESVKKNSQSIGIKQPISMEHFNRLYSAMKNQFNASDKYKILNDALDVRTNYFTMFQLNNLLSLINPETDRLILAKKASSHLLEEANAAALLEVFSSPDSKDQLLRHFDIKN